MATETTQALLDRLKRHYIKTGTDLPGGVFVPEVGQNGGWGAGSRCDAIFVGFTSTSGRILVGHELKVSRADWLHELSQPGKSDAWADACHEWWLVVPDPSIVHDGELPAGWGLMSPSRRSNTRMQVHAEAPRKPDSHTPPWEAVRSIMARQDTLRAKAIQDAVQDQVDKRIADYEQRTGHAETALRDRCRRAEDDFMELREAITGTKFGRLPDAEVMARIGDLARTHTAVEDAKRVLFGNWQLSRLDDALAELHAALDDMKTDHDLAIQEEA